MVLKKIKALLSRRSKRPPTEVDGIPDKTPAGGSLGLAAPQIHRGPEVVHHPVALQDLDPDAVRIVRRLTRFDYAGYLVGGCELRPRREAAQ